ncbi:hypothetical protein AB1Y20_000904 [Prymnesium parvum]|uniref:Adenylate kinase n=1 Tax=Prymnesium parvum TaxID=97485 RepID=A0AB34K9I3_PRYPA
MRWVALVGPPASEARFFASLLSARMGAPLVSVHKAAALERAHRTFLGQQLDAHAAEHAGELFPLPLVAQLLRPPLERAARSESGMVGANFPRGREQWRMLRTFAPPAQVIHLTGRPAELRGRIAHRRVCAACEAPMYPPPEAMAKAAAAEAEKRSVPRSAALFSHLVEAGCVEPSPRREKTDEGAPLDTRWAVYEEKTLPMLAELRESQATKVIDVEIDVEPDETWKRILKACDLPYA